MSKSLTRREFMHKAAIGAAGLTIASSGLLSSSRVLGANDRLSIGIVGPGQRGRRLIRDMGGVSEDCNAEITAVCDIWSQNLDRGAKMVEDIWGKAPRKFRNLEDMVALNDLDGVIIGTADFQHAQHLVETARAGKDSYCEKPLANDLQDARDALRAVEETGQIVQIGSQRRSEGRFIAAAELVQSGILGKITKVDTSWNYYGARWRRGDVDQVREEDTDWRRFLMGKRYRPFDPHQYMEWRLFHDFSTGIPCQWMSHMIDVVHWFTGEQFPSSVVAHGGIYHWKDGREVADTFHALLEYPKGFLVSYSTRFANDAGDGTFVYGTNGTLDCRAWKITGTGGGGDGKLTEEIDVTPKGGVHHMKDWLDCMRARKQPNADINTGYQHSIASLMSHMAMMSGERMTYNPATQEIREG